jgi:hypothetical protein
MSSRNASRSRIMSSPEAQSLQEQEEFTFEVKSPDHPLSPTGTRRQYSLSSPQLGGSGSASRANSTGFGYRIDVQDPDHDSLDLPPSIGRTPSSSPRYSTAALPAGDTFSVDGSIQPVPLDNDRIFPIVPEFFQRYERSLFA